MTAPSKPSSSVRACGTVASRDLAEIIHEADLRDGKFPRDEARGIDLAIRGFLAAYPDDHEVLTHGLGLFEGLYAGASRKE